MQAKRTGFVLVSGGSVLLSLVDLPPATVLEKSDFPAVAVNTCSEEEVAHRLGRLSPQVGGRKSRRRMWDLEG